ncbi:MAG: DUF167 domain-containing protein [Patescibacteria group bacterium]|jgi:hypothetical protein
MFSEFQKKLKKDGFLYLRIKSRPGAAKTEVREIMADGTMKINIAAPAVKGKANQELIGFLAKEFGLKKGCASIISGAGDKLKLVKITG